jgi:hypothetical protein
MKTTIEYGTNNSGGSWWLHDKDWIALANNGWEIDTEYLAYDNSLHYARKTYELPEKFALMQAKEDFENATGQYADEEGCPCCGPPHNFYSVPTKDGT